MKIDFGPATENYIVCFIGSLASNLLKVQTGIIAFSVNVVFYLTDSFRQFTLYGKIYFF